MVDFKTLTKIDIERHIGTRLIDKEARWDYPMSVYGTILELFPEELHSFLKVKWPKRGQFIDIQYKDLSFIGIDVHRSRPRIGEPVFKSFKIYFIDNVNIGQRIDYLENLLAEEKEEEDKTEKEAVDLLRTIIKITGKNKDDLRDMINYIHENRYNLFSEVFKEQ